MSRNFELIKQLEQISPALRRPALSQPATRPQPVTRQEPATSPEPEPEPGPEPVRRQPLSGRQYSLGDAGILFGEEVVLLVHNVFLAHSSPRQTVVFCGVDAENGSSAVCASAGRALAAISGKSVCLVDGNLRDARLSKALGSPRDQKPLNKTATLYERCSSLEGNLSLAATDLLTDAYGGLPPAPELTQRLAWLEGAFDFVLIDTPGVTAAKDAAILGAAAGALILVVEAEKTRKPAARQAKQSLEAAGVHVLGAVLRNHAEPIPANLLKSL
jgi:Mrp family chromosome partitioning ATPase